MVLERQEEDTSESLALPRYVFRSHDEEDTQQPEDAELFHADALALRAAGFALGAPETAPGLVLVEIWRWLRRRE